MREAPVRASTLPAWAQSVTAALRRHRFGIVTYVPDPALAPLISGIAAEPSFRTFATSREEETLAIAAGAYMAGSLGACLMQTSGFVSLVNVLGSLIVPYRIPLAMFVAERGALGDNNIVQVTAARAMRPVLDAYGVIHHTIARQEDLDFALDPALHQAIQTQSPVTFILSPYLTGIRMAKEAK